MRQCNDRLYQEFGLIVPPPFGHGGLRCPPGCDPMPESSNRFGN
jgi:hypothetical protein